MLIVAGCSASGFVSVTVGDGTDSVTAVPVPPSVAASVESKPPSAASTRAALKPATATTVRRASARSLMGVDHARQWTTKFRRYPPGPEKLSWPGIFTNGL